MLCCNWLTETGHSDLCAAFQMHLNYECVAGRYPHHPVAHPQDDESVDSSILLSVGHLSHLQISVDESNYALREDMAAHYSGGAGVDGITGLSQESSRSPVVCMQLAGPGASCLDVS